MVSDGHQLLPGTWGQTRVQFQLSHGALRGPSTSPSHPQFLLCEMGTKGYCEEQPLPAHGPGLTAISLARAASVASSILQSLAQGGCPCRAFHVHTWMSNALRKLFSNCLALKVSPFTSSPRGRFLPLTPGLSHCPFVMGLCRPPGPLTLWAGVRSGSTCCRCWERGMATSMVSGCNGLARVAHVARPTQMFPADARTFLL